MKKMLFVLTASVALSGCATEQRQIDSHAPALDSWIGAPVIEFLELHDGPTETVAMADHLVLRFDASKTRTQSVMESEVCEPKGGVLNTARCEKSDGGYTYRITWACTYALLVFEGVIREWRMDGNNCRMVNVSHRPA